MATYTRLEMDDVINLAGQFGIEADGLQRVAPGVENTSYIITSNDRKVVLTILEKRKLAAAIPYSAYLCALKEGHFDVPKLFSCGNGRYVTEFAGKPVLLGEYIQGTSYDPLPAEYLRQIGVTLGRLHTSAVKCPLKPYIRLSEADLVVASAFEDRRFGEWLIRTHREVAGIIDLNYPRVATHGDIFPDNIVIGENGRIFLIDWDDGARDAFLVDLGIAVLGLCCSDGFEPDRLNLLLAGYRSTNSAEFNSLDLLHWTIYIATFTAFNRYQKRSFVYPAFSPKRSYQEVPPMIESVMRSWNRVAL